MTGEEIRILEDERVDDLMRNGYRIIQKKEGFCFGMDAVLLSGFASVRKKETAVDLGTGTGIIPILLRAKTEGRSFYGIEVQEQVAEMAERSVRLNGLSGEIRILQGNLRQILEEGGRISFPRAGAPGSIEELSAGGIDVVTSNPPYMKGEHGLQNPQEMKAISRHEILCTLPEVCAAAAKLLRTGGRFYMVHRPLRLSEIMEALRQNRLEPKRMKFVHPFIDREANMVLIEAVKDAKSQCRVEKPVIVYREPGKYTEEIYETYGY